MKSIIVAYDKNRGIGADNDLLWHRDLPADARHFKELSLNKTVVMGRKTYESIGRPLPNRQNIVVSRRTITIPGCEVVGSLDEAYRIARSDIVLAGGQSIYEQGLNDTDVIYATEVDASFPQASVFFPPLEPEWHEIAREHHQADEKNKYNFDFVTYQRA